MVNKFIFNNATEVFETLYDEIMTNGVTSHANTKALFNVGFTILNPMDNIITTPWRKFNTKYADREWNWYLSQNRSVKELKKFAPIWDKMHDPNDPEELVNSNYGWQWNRNNQLQHVINELKTNPTTRHAWITIYDGKEKDTYKYDTPCTLNIGFYITDNKLNMSVIMRSNDLIYGFCNDQYNFSKLQKMVADELGIDVGTYYHYSANMHIYQMHFNMKQLGE